MIDQAKIDKLKTLLIDQSIREFEEAAEAGEKIDPRRLTAAFKLLESADPRVFKPEEPTVVDKVTGEVKPADRKWMKHLRGKAHLLPFLNDDERKAIQGVDDGQPDPVNE